MQIPVRQRFIQRLGQFVEGFKPAALERQGTQLLPPGFNQVQPTGVLRDELDLNFRPGGQSEFDLLAGVNGQVVFDQQPTVRRKLQDHLLQQLEMTGAIPSWAHPDRGLPAGWLKGSMHPQLAASAIIRFKGGPLGTYLPFFARIGLNRQRPQLVQADHSGAFRWRQIGCDDAPLFSTNWGSCFSASLSLNAL